MLYYTYILLLTNGKYYTGITNNLERRLSEHNNNKSISTRYRTPVKLIYKNSHTSRTSARNEEVIIKNTGAGKYLTRLKYCNNFDNLTTVSPFIR